MFVVTVEQVVALYNYAAQHDDELTFAKASVINVLDKSDPDWWRGEVNGTVGVFPVNYVAPLAERFAQQTAAVEESTACEYAVGFEGILKLSKHNFHRG